ncbi:MAG: MerR family transcriptional regulator [Eubacteriales bacterium]
MEYAINKLAQMSGISTRALRYYDSIGLLRPARVSSNGYRIYSQNEVDKLQQILFYREMGISLDEIKTILNAPGFDKEKALQNHLTALLQKKEQLEKLVINVGKTIDSLKGGSTMIDEEKFDGFKQKLVDENEQSYGKEVREKFGDAAIDASNTKLKGMTQEQYNTAQKLSGQINETLKAAMETGDPACEGAQKVCELHKQWLCMYWAEGMYSKQVHKGLGEMYVADERFKAYYDKIANGAAEFLRDALNIYCAE